MEIKEIFKEYADNTALSEGHYDYMMDEDSFIDACKILISFHVIAALESASKEGKIIDEDGDTYHQPHIFHCNGEEYKNWIDKNSILNAYPLNLIK